MAERDITTRNPELFVVFGGTGFVGHRIVQELLSAGHRVRIAARNPVLHDAQRKSGEVEMVRADLFEPETLRTALKGAAGAVNATSLYAERDEITFEAVHVEAAQRLARLARQARLARLVQLSGLGADETASDSYIRARGRGEKAVSAAFPEAVIVRPSVMFGRGDALVASILGAARMAPVIPLFGSGRTRLQPVAANDVAKGIAMLLTQRECAPLHEFGGPRVMQYRELVQEILGAAKLRRPLVPFPFGAWKLIAGLAENLPGAPLTRSQVALVAEDRIANPDLPGLGDLLPTRTDFADYLAQEFPR